MPRKPSKIRRKQQGGVGANVWTSHLLRLDKVESEVLHALDTTHDTLAALADRYGVNAHSLSHWVAERRGESHLKDRMARLMRERAAAKREIEDAPKPSTSDSTLEESVRQMRRAERTWSFTVHALGIDLDQLAASRAAYFDEGLRMAKSGR